MKKYFGACRKVSNKLVQQINDYFDCDGFHSRYPPQLDSHQVRTALVTSLGNPEKAVKAKATREGKHVDVEKVEKSYSGTKQPLLNIARIEPEDFELLVPQPVREQTIFKEVIAFNTHSKGIYWRNTGRDTHLKDQRRVIDYSHFASMSSMKLRRKKNPKQSIAFPGREIRQVTWNEQPSEGGSKISGSFSLFPRAGLGRIELRGKKHDMNRFKKAHEKTLRQCEIVYDGRYYWLHYVIEEDNNAEEIRSKYEHPESIISIDPGCRSLVTGYTPEGTIEVHVNLAEVERKALLQESLGKKDLNLHKKRNRKEHLAARDRMKSAHINIAKHLAKTYQTIIIGKLDTQELVQGDLNGQVKRALNYLSPYQFRQRLALECAKVGGKLIVQHEWLTTKRCGRCSKINDPGKSKNYHCNHCGFTSDRDVNAARNILANYIAGVIVIPASKS